MFRNVTGAKRLIFVKLFSWRTLLKSPRLNVLTKNIFEPVSVNPDNTYIRRKIRLIDSNAKCRYLKKFTNMNDCISSL
jgi:hypothetical protein